MDTLIWVLAWLTPGTLVLSRIHYGIKNPSSLDEEESELLNQYCALSSTQTAFIVIGILLMAPPIVLVNWTKRLLK